ncbi:hypothetical protein FA95DRAFT_1555054 [Auriscalpium vulgare]|uniref:Uncharacterized protein n=1 Tax=Auriscalpium vulgare TaxID=40419 RepID=A0ACB8S3A5_9AGAM|nr:hypothetical protein FA95DRAFT_1555054 [Auriscalpium vulgare]
MAGQIIYHAAPSPITASFPEGAVRRRPQQRSRSSAKFLERRLVRMWKRVTRSMHTHERASIVPEGFVLMNNAARRRSMFILGA